MPSENKSLEALKFILENSQHPERLDSHPWAHSLLAGQAGNASDSPGTRLVSAITSLFIESMPSAPPRQGKRLDTRWGEFGLLAAQYFVPILHGAPVPASLRDAWGRIDAAILLFVFGKPEENLSPDERDSYALVARERDVAPHSTLSDWHRKGLQRLLDAILAREAYLSQTLSQPAGIFVDGRELTASPGDYRAKTPRSKAWRWAALVFGLLLSAFLIVGGIKAWQVYEHAMSLRQDVARLQEVLSSSSGNLEKARRAGPLLGDVRGKFLTLKEEVGPFLWLGPLLGWVPDYGGELRASSELLEYGDALLAAADTSYQALAPLLEPDALDGLTPADVVSIMKQAEPDLLEARADLERAMAARELIPADTLSPTVSRILVNQLDPMVGLMHDGLTLATELPRALGASGEGPKTYLLLAQNEDELRPTGGFITAAGVILVQDGNIVNPVFKNSGYLEDWSKPYPSAPWPLFHYMNSPVLIFRDTTWFTNYPTTALYAEQLYSYVSAHSVDGVVAFNQQFLVKLLRATGPITVPGESTPISAGNAIEYMRAAKIPTPEELKNPEWETKTFLNDIAGVLLEKIMGGEVGWERLSETILSALSERDLLIQVDNPVLAGYLVRQGWDGAVRPGDADFLMVADTNIGFNKTSALVETRLDYEVDLRSLVMPSATLSISHQNNAPDMYTCAQWGNKPPTKDENQYPINDCYWTYTRIYKPQGTSLVDSIAQFVPANWMLNYRSVPPRVDVLDDEGIEGVQAFGTLKVIPGGQSETTMIRFALPLSVLQLQAEDGLLAYRLRVQKQPGTDAVPLSLRIYLPPGAGLYRVPDGAGVDGDVITYSITLRTDFQFEILFYAP
jgi:hypothetical protein